MKEISMDISNKSRLFAVLIIFAYVPCYAPLDIPSTPQLNEQMNTLNKRVRFYFKCLRRKCTIEERNAALWAALKDGAALSTLIVGAGFAVKYGLHRRAIQQISPILTDIQNQDYPIVSQDGEIRIDYNEELRPEILDITAVSETINYTGISSNLNNLLEQIFKLKKPYFKTIIIQLLGKDDSLAYRFELINNRWEQITQGIRKKGERNYRTLPRN